LRDPEQTACCADVGVGLAIIAKAVAMTDGVRVIAFARMRLASNLSVIFMQCLQKNRALGKCAKSLPRFRGRPCRR
jgi:hypothetical protein